MSAPSRRLVAQCTGRIFADRTFYAAPIPFRLRCRAASSKNNDSSAKANPILEDYNRRQAAKDAEAAASGEADPMRMEPQAGDIDTSSIFADDARISQQRGGKTPSGEAEDKSTEHKLDPAIMEPVLNPDPVARARWERRKVIQAIKRGGRVTRDQYIKRTEREHLVKSHNMKTSVKKLGMLARQIAGKKLEDAIVQMRFSKKKIAQEVLKQLEFARDEAIVMRGMGLGLAAVPPPAGDATSTDLAVRTPKPKPLDIELKSGRRHTVTDPSDIYISQAYVGRGPYGKLPDFRARGRIFIMRTPWTSISLVLKEEVSRVREWREREEKRKKQRTGEKVWQQLPDRPIQGQRQWYSW